MVNWWEIGSNCDMYTLQDEEPKWCFQEEIGMIYEQEQPLGVECAQGRDGKMDKIELLKRANYCANFQTSRDSSRVSYPEGLYLGVKLEFLLNPTQFT